MNLDKIFEATRAMLALVEKMKLSTEEWQQAQALANAELFHRERQAGWEHAANQATLGRGIPTPYLADTE